MPSHEERDALYGTEWDFLALDAAGSLAQLSSAGFGPIPERVLDHVDLVEAAVEELSLLPVLGDYVDVRPHPRDGDYSDWFEMSRRGLFAYDWCYDYYEHVATPKVPLTLTDLAPSLRKAASLLRLPFRFADTTRFVLDDTALDM